MTITIIVPQPELRVSKNPSPLFLNKSPKINATISIPSNIPIVLKF